jgi:thermopsin
MSKILALIIIALLLLPVQLGIQASSEVDYDVVSLNPDYYAWTRVNVTSDGLLVLMYSTSPLTFMVMTPSQFWQFFFS